ncbi:hypothetical protein SapgrDRAFT_3316 [Saprospira grandis DSM 2844]|uniref:Tetratricopeptide repeat protein n=1 Tax=Saprospira grandis DSM 2844 TaxID=694433 RepID=J0P507_9BACT|nr:DUF6340 family protein [Saprospira grandis]EJF54959.1 hypothetical protein SapgrDRAFT_3316 [Saprospira grandis DSM 2844]
MKENLPNLLLLIFSALLLSSCSIRKSVSYYQMRSPDLYLPDSLDQILVWNHAFSNKKGNQLLINTLEGLASGESVGDDRQAAQGLLKGLEETLVEERKREQQKIDTSYGRLQLSGEIPPPLPDSFLRALAKKGQLLASLEMVDSDQEDPHTEYARNGGQGRAPRPTATSKIHLRVCWRLYDLERQEVIDIWRSGKQFSGNSNSSDYDVVGQIISPFKSKKMKFQGYQLGRQYAMRICSTMVQKRRYIYHKGQKEMKTAYKLVKKGDWEEAAKIWRQLLDTNEQKLRGKLLFNLAVYEEQKGKLANAETLAREAFFLNAFQPAREYYKWLAKERKRIKNYKRQQELPWPN